MNLGQDFRLYVSMPQFQQLIYIMAIEKKCQKQIERLLKI